MKEGNHKSLPMHWEPVLLQGFVTLRQAILGSQWLEGLALQPLLVCVSGVTIQ